jgi:hypothetical protein
MPIERITLSILDEPLNDLITWLPRDGGSDEFKQLDTSTETERIVCTHPSNPSILDTMIAMIDNAKEKIFLCNWMLSYSKVEDSLARAASRLNGRVHVLTTLETSVYSRYTDDDEALNDLGRLQKLAAEGVYIRLHPEAHAKFMIVDREVLVTSANIRDTSLEKNIETGVLISNPKIVADFRSIFSYLWLQEAKQHIRPSRADPRLGNAWKSDQSEPPNFDGGACWTLSNRRMSLAKQIIATIKSAKESLRISTYAFSSLETGIGNQILNSIIEADERGVQTTILYHATSTAIGRPPREHESYGFRAIARCKNVRMVGHPRLHAKHVIADGERGLMFTANLDGLHGLNSGIEVGVMLSIQACSDLSKWHDSLFKTFPLEFVFEPTPFYLSSKGGTKLINLPKTSIFWTNDGFEDVKERITNLTKYSSILSAESERWIEPETKNESKRPKPYEDRVKPPSIKSGIITRTGLKLFESSKVILATKTDLNTDSLYHGHLQPGNYEINLGRQFDEDELLEIIEELLPAPERGVALNEVVTLIKSKSKIPEIEIPFKLNDVGVEEYIKAHSNRGLLKSNPVKNGRLMPILTDIEAAELLKPHLGKASYEELQAILDAEKKPHELKISKQFLERINAILEPSHENDDD